MKILTLILLFFTFINAKSIEASYKVSFGIFGQIGIAKASLHVSHDGNYTINMHAKSTGLSSFLSGQRQEWYKSSGKLDTMGFLRPDTYSKVVQKNVNTSENASNSFRLKKDTKNYTLDHKHKKVMVSQQKKLDEKIIATSNETLEYYAQNDLLSLFFNFKDLLYDTQKPLVLHAVGANKKDGKIEITPISDTKALQEEFGWSEGVYLKVTLNDKIFASEKGELLINLNDAGIAQNAVLKDVLFFGDIRGDLIK
ncbi:MAG: DUF3108 domain-containing protein [Sulfurospirillum sp.]|nr:DUF3108 domain-containing protein [Sulfurospirillum sp.]